MWSNHPYGFHSMGEQTGAWGIPPGPLSQSKTKLGFIGEGDGTLLQCSCLENPMGGGAWWAAVHGVAKSRTRLSDFTFPDTSFPPRRSSFQTCLFLEFGVLYFRAQKTIQNKPL